MPCAGVLARNSNTAPAASNASAAMTYTGPSKDPVRSRTQPTNVGMTSPATLPHMLISAKPVASPAGPRKVGGSVQKVLWAAPIANPASRSAANAIEPVPSSGVNAMKTADANAARLTWRCRSCVRSECHAFSNMPAATATQGSAAMMPI
jgi:hypothetical protein